MILSGCRSGEEIGGKGSSTIGNDRMEADDGGENEDGEDEGREEEGGDGCISASSPTTVKSLP